MSHEQRPCETCKPGDPTNHPTAISETGCQEAYDAVDRCMLAHGGNVGDCKREWDLFRACHEGRQEKGPR
ncbi:unnamed protein product [Choristocarpus tenellus]